MPRRPHCACRASKHPPPLIRRAPLHLGRRHQRRRRGGSRCATLLLTVGGGARRRGGTRGCRRCRCRRTTWRATRRRRAAATCRSRRAGAAAAVLVAGGSCVVRRRGRDDGPCREGRRASQRHVRRPRHAQHAAQAQHVCPLQRRRRTGSTWQQVVHVTADDGDLGPTRQRCGGRRAPHHARQWEQHAGSMITQHARRARRTVCVVTQGGGRWEDSNVQQAATACRARCIHDQHIRCARQRCRQRCLRPAACRQQPCRTLPRWYQRCCHRGGRRMRAAATAACAAAVSRRRRPCRRHDANRPRRQLASDKAACHARQRRGRLLHRHAARCSSHHRLLLPARPVRCGVQHPPSCHLHAVAQQQVRQPRRQRGHVRRMGDAQARKHGSHVPWRRNRRRRTVMVPTATDATTATASRRGRAPRQRVACRGAAVAGRCTAGCRCDVCGGWRNVRGGRHCVRCVRCMWHRCR